MRVPSISMISERASKEWLARACSVIGVRAEAADMLRLSGVIGDPWGDGITAAAVAQVLGKTAPSALTIVLNSPGGDPFEAIAIGDLLRSRATRLTMRVTGMAASAASVLACYADHIEMATGSLMMVHAPWTIAIGKAADMRASAELLDSVALQMASIYGKRLGQEVALAAVSGSEELWYDADAAIAAGLCNAKIDNVPAPTPAEDPAKAVALAERLTRLDARLKGY
jgi:ATP-dependent protease ClpP protease subunit